MHMGLDRTVTHVILSPLGLGLLLLVAQWGCQRGGYRRSQWLLRMGCAGCLLMLTPLGANSLVRLIEGAQHPVSACAHEADRPLVLLTGGLDYPARTADDFASLTPSSSHRLYALMATGLLTEPHTLLITGGSLGQAIPESRVVGQLAVRLGVPAERIQLEEHASSTRDNARLSAAMLLPASPKITLVTSALHMQRAQWAFAQQGFDVCPQPVDWAYVPPTGWGYLLPQSSALLKSEQAIHELIGLIAYRWR